jgi:hypothetical protein
MALTTSSLKTDQTELSSFLRSILKKCIKAEGGIPATCLNAVEKVLKDVNPLLSARYDSLYLTRSGDFWISSMMYSTLLVCT